MSSKRSPFDKYAYYLSSVQDPPQTVDFLERAYREVSGGEPHRLREDFCGTFALCCEWSDRDRRNIAYGLDLDSEPLDYGGRYYLPQLEPAVRRRVHALQGNVLHRRVPPVDIAVALNFSYYALKEREVLLSYFRKARAGLRPKGLLILDAFGGIDTHAPIEEKSAYDDFTYYWDQVSFDPITYHARFYIHFKRKGEAKRKRVFRYDWRMWTLPELKDCLREAGFRETRIYWEGTTPKGEGNGKFHPTTSEEDCEAWVAYVVARK